MATSNQSMQETLPVQRTRRRRLLLIALFGLAAIVWGPKAAIVLVDGWVKSNQVIEYQRELEDTRERIYTLEHEVAECDTPPGKDVEARRRFGVGPEDEIGIIVEAEPATDAPPAPVSIADRVNRWLRGAVGDFTDRLRDAMIVVRYWVGVDEVEHGVPIEEAAGDADDPADHMAPHEEAFGDGEDGG